ncbi:unnamed protein product [Phytophthora lilii]|uniref:Unnamed protein product n=1 Tax=Phytophthora lilii TaxID=2077276 RepID=A0A9W6TFN4_9STRA|nr:unnamed protein product [Phytophthora lilii]
MTLSGILKLGTGPFWFKTPILLVNVVPFGSRSASYVLRVERPVICGGRIDLPIGRRDLPIDLLPRSVKDRRRLRFSIRYGAKGKTLRFLAPTAEVYGHWITVLREAFGGTVKIPKRQRNETASTIDESGAAISDSDEYSNYYRREVASVTRDNYSMCGQRGSDELNTSVSCTPFSQRSNSVPDADVSTTTINSGGTVVDTTSYNATSYARQAEEEETPALSSVEDHHGINTRDNTDRKIRTDDVNDLPPTRWRQSGLTSSCPSYDDIAPDGVVDLDQQNVYCVATDHLGVTSFSIYSPPKTARRGCPAQPERVFTLLPMEWARCLARDICDAEFLPEVFHLTGSGCKRLQMSEMLAIAQPYFA